MGDEDQYIIAIDFESAGGVPYRNGFTQLGACLVRMSDGAVLAKFSEYANMRGYEWDPRCVREFWEKNPELYEETKKITSDEKTPTPYDVVRNFNIWVDVETKSIRDKVYIISDNAAFDIAMLRAFSDRDILYTFGGYREMVDISSAYMGMSRRRVTVGLMNEWGKMLARSVVSEMNGGVPFEPTIETAHDHHAVNDAIHMAQYWVAVQRMLPK